MAFVKSNPFKESSALFKYAYIDQDDNLRILVPISSGETIGRDNTCQSAKELKDFFNNSDNFLRVYIGALEDDVRRDYIDREALENKQKRLEQARLYRQYIPKIRSEIHNLLPTQIEKLICESHDISSAVLRPKSWDPHGLPRERNFAVDYGNPMEKVDCLAARLRNYFAQGQIEVLSDRDKLKNAVLKKLTDGAVTTFDQDAIRAIIKIFEDQSELLLGNKIAVPDNFDSIANISDYVEIENLEDYIENFINASSRERPTFRVNLKANI